MSLANIRQDLINLKAQMIRQDVQHIKIDAHQTTIFNQDKERIYIPNSTAQKFSIDETFVKLIIGPYGSGKSTMCVHKIVEHACSMPIWSSGRRRAKWLIVRNTSGELQSTTLQTWLQWFGELGVIKKRQKPLLTYEHTFNDGNGIIELELVFIALDRDDDIRKLKSIEATGAYINELSEVPQAVLHHLIGRVNHRYPSVSFCDQAYWSGIICDTNPPDTDHWIFKDFETNPTPNYKIFHQPSGLLTADDGSFLKDSTGNYLQNKDADNAQNLSADYYPKLAEKRTEGFIKVYCAGQYGIVESGKRVYPEYNDDIHSAHNVTAIQGLPIHLGWDFGLTPACIVIQVTSRGRILILKEYTSEDMGIRTFAQNIVLPSLPVDFPYNKVGESQADPAGNTSDGIMEELSCIGELNSLGIKTNGSHTNDPIVRIGAVRYFLNTMIDGQPALQLNRDLCPILRKGFINGYHYKRLSVTGDERYQDKPNKNKYSHIHDSAQYILLHFASGQIAETKQDHGPKIDYYNPVMRI